MGSVFSLEASVDSRVFGWFWVVLMMLKDIRVKDRKAYKKFQVLKNYECLSFLLTVLYHFVLFPCLMSLNNKELCARNIMKYEFQRVYISN